MKTRNIYLAITALAVFAGMYFMFGCKRENVKRVSPLIHLRQSGCENDLSLVCEGAIPEFGSQQAFEDAYQCLEQEYEDYNDSMEAAHVHLSDDAYDDYVDSVGFNEEATLDAWETDKGYTSMRTALNAAEDTWLAGGMIGTDPFDNALADIIFMTLLNSNGNVKVGGSLFHIDADGSQIEVTNGDCEELADAIADPEYTSSNVQRITIPLSYDTCKYREFEKGMNEWTHNSSRRFSWRVDFDSYVVDCRVKALMRNFRKKNNGNWKRAAATSHVYLGGQVWNNECNQSSLISYKDVTKRRKRVHAKRWPQAFAKIRTSDINGLFEPTEDGPAIDTAIAW